METATEACSARRSKLRLRDSAMPISKQFGVRVLLTVASFAFGGLFGALALAHYSAKQMRLIEAARLGKTAIALNHIQAGNTNGAIRVLEHELAASVMFLLHSADGRNHSNDDRANAALDLARRYFAVNPPINDTSQVIEDAREMLKNVSAAITNGLNSAR